MDTYRGFSVIMPAFNEEKAIEDVIRGVVDRFSEIEIVVVDDGSTDSTAEIVSRFETVRLIQHERNRGYGASIKTGIRHATGDIICWYDADGQHSPDSLDDLLKEYRNGDYDAVIGSRTKGSDAPGNRALGKAALSIIVQLVAGRRIPDINCGLRAFSAPVIMQYLPLLPDGFSASITTTLLMLKRGYRVTFTPVVARPRVGKSTVKQFRDGWRSIHISLRILVMFQAFLFFSTVSTLLTAGGLSYSLYTSVTTKLGFPVLGAIIILTGVLIFFMGLVCDQITALRIQQLELPQIAYRPEKEQSEREP